MNHHYRFWLSRLALVAVLLALPVHAATVLWNGAGSMTDNFFSNTNNWAADSVPVNNSINGASVNFGPLASGAVNTANCADAGMDQNSGEIGKVAIQYGRGSPGSNLNLDSAVGKNRKPREPRENKGQGETVRSQKAFTQWVNGLGFRNPCRFVYLAYFAVSIADFRLNDYNSFG